MAACAEIRGPARPVARPVLGIGMLQRIFHLTAMLILVALPCVPQREIRAVTGVVTDRKGNTVKGAVVHLENTTSLLVTSYITGNDGRYRFNRLYGDVDYTLKAKYQSCWSKRKTLSKFDSWKQREVDLVIPIELHPALPRGKVLLGSEDSVEISTSAGADADYQCG